MDVKMDVNLTDFTLNTLPYEVQSCDISQIYKVILSHNKKLITLMFMGSILLIILRLVYKYNYISELTYMDWTYRINIFVIFPSIALFMFSGGFD